jgi:hypothetical protein
MNGLKNKNKRNYSKVGGWVNDEQMKILDIIIMSSRPKK